MARARNIKPGFFKNEVLAEMPMEARMLFIGLWTLADREGRLEDRPKRIKMELFPYDSFDVDPMLSRLQADGFLTRYEVGGVRFIQIENFVKHQDPHYKEKASEIPPPEGVEDIIKATAVTRGQRVRILERDGYRCQLCGAETHLCIDHVIPVSRGGDSSDDNLQVLCHSCNTKKGNKLDGEEKGQKKSIHRPGAVIARPNVGSNSNQQKRPSPSDSLSSDSLSSDSLIPDSLTPSTEGVARTLQGEACMAMKSVGMAGVNPSNPKLTALLEAGITVAELVAAAADAVAKGKPFAYALASAEGRRRDAATAPLPNVQPDTPVETYAQRAARQRMEEVAPMAARKAPGAAFDAAQRFMHGGDVVDVTPTQKQLQGA